MNRLTSPKSGPAWLRWVEESISRLEERRPVMVPVGGMVLSVTAAVPPPNWLRANGATFSAVQYPVLASRVGSTTLPNPAPVSGFGWIIRAG